MTMISRQLARAAAILLFAVTASGETIDRIAAVIDRQVITLSEVNQMVTLRFFPRGANREESEYRHDVLEALIAQALRYRDVERFGAQDIPKDSIEARYTEMVSRFPSPSVFATTLASVELTPDEVRALVKRQLQVEAYIQERFSPLVFIPNEEIEAYYRGPWSDQRRARGLAVPLLDQVRDEIRALLKSERLQSEIDKWTAQLRARVNVDVYAWK